ADDSAFRPAKEMLKEPFGTYKAINRALEDNPWIRRKSPSSNRLLIHAGDWSKFWPNCRLIRSTRPRRWWTPCWRSNERSCQFGAGSSGNSLLYFPPTSRILQKPPTNPGLFASCYFPSKHLKKVVGNLGE